MKILNLLPRLPTPPVDGGAIAVLRMMLALKERGVDWVVVSFESNRHPQEVKECSSLFTTYALPGHFPEMTPLNALRHLADPLPYNIALRFRSTAMEELLGRVQKEHPDFDLIQVEWAHMGIYFKILRQLWPDTPVVLRQHNVEYRLLERMAERQTSLAKRAFAKLQAKRMKRFEARICAECDHVITLTPQDRDLLLGAGNAQSLKSPRTAEPSLTPKRLAERVTVIPAGIDMAIYERPEEKNEQGNPIPTRQNQFLIIGSLGWEPYAESVAWFVENVWLPFHIRHPQMALRIVGTYPPPRLKQLHGKNGIDVAGYVEDVLPEFHGALAMLLPLRSGSGMRIKVLEAAAASLPILSTPLGIEGIPLKDGVSCLLADTPEEWIRAMETLAEDQELAERLSSAAKREVEPFSVSRRADETLALFESFVKK